MARISIIGTGNMGQAIAGIARAGGNEVEQFDQSTPDAPVSGDIVVLAVPYPAVAGILAKRGDEFVGKVVVDITNPLNFETFDSRRAAGQLGQVSTTVLIAGDDAEAKAQLARVIAAGGLAALDVGGLSRARELEAIGFLQITLAAAGKVAWTGGFAVIA